MEWYWWIFFVVVALIVLQSVPKLLPPIDKKPAAPKLDDLRSIAFASVQETPRNEERPQVEVELRPYVTRLCRVHGSTGSFASHETRVIGEEINEKYGCDSMVDVLDEVCRVLGNGAARDLEYNWAGIGGWRK
jgi:hypothetical protein